MDDENHTVAKLLESPDYNDVCVLASLFDIFSALGTAVRAGRNVQVKMNIGLIEAKASNVWVTITNAPEVSPDVTALPEEERAQKALASFQALQQAGAAATPKVKRRKKRRKKKAEITEDCL